MSLQHFFDDVDDAEHLVYKIFAEYLSIPIGFYIYHNRITNDSDIIVIQDLLNNETMLEIYPETKIKKIYFGKNNQLFLFDKKKNVYFCSDYFLFPSFSNYKKIKLKLFSSEIISVEKEINIIYLQKNDFYIIEYDYEIYFCEFFEESLTMNALFLLDHEREEKNSYSFIPYFKMICFRYFEETKQFFILYELGIFPSLYYWKFELPIPNRNLLPHFVYKHNVISIRSRNYFVQDFNLLFFVTNVKTTETFVEFTSKLLSYNILEEKIDSVQTNSSLCITDAEDIFVVKNNKNFILVSNRHNNVYYQVNLQTGVLSEIENMKMLDNFTRLGHYHFITKPLDETGLKSIFHFHIDEKEKIKIHEVCSFIPPKHGFGVMKSFSQQNLQENYLLKNLEQLFLQRI